MKLISTQLKREWEDNCGKVGSSETVRSRLGLHGRSGKNNIIRRCVLTGQKIDLTGQY